MERLNSESDSNTYLLRAGQQSFACLSSSPRDKQYFVLAIYSTLVVLELETFSNKFLKCISEFPDFKFCAVWTLSVMGTAVANITLDLKYERKSLIGVFTILKNHLLII